jgi:energy-coupling factor transporter ATP-binding protein EcfA2
LTGGPLPIRPATEDLPSAADVGEAYLRCITVEGFRGIGTRTTVQLSPGPGLTLITGRNGSGKSSFVEGLEVLLTGSSYRWDGKGQKVWRDGWRNLHHPQSFVEAELLVVDAGPTTVTRSWIDGEVDVANSAVSVRRSSGEPSTDFASLGWGGAVVEFRPFLTYSELGSLLEEGPSRLYDTLSSILGLSELVAAEKALRDARLTRKRALDEAKEDLEPLLANLTQLDDERARRSHEALSSPTWNLDAVEREVTGTREVDGSSSQLLLLRELSVLQAPSEPDVANINAELERAVAENDAVAGTDAHRASQLAELLSQAVAVHLDHEAIDCPVCGRKDALDATWKDRTLEEISHLRAEATAAEAARVKLKGAMSRGRECLTGPPRSLLEGGSIGIETHELRQTWGAWQAGAEIEDPAALIAHLSESVEGLTHLIGLVREQAAAALREREDRWRPAAERTAEWVQRARPAADGAAKIKDLKKARTGSGLPRPKSETNASNRSQPMFGVHGRSFETDRTWISRAHLCRDRVRIAGLSCP